MNGQLTRAAPGDILAIPEAWPRADIDSQRVGEFHVLYENEGIEALPPLEIVHGGTRPGFILVDGWHRITAILELGFDSVPVVIVPIPPGEDAISFAYRRGLELSARVSKPLTRAEKQAAIARLLYERPGESDRAIARLVGVDHKTVGRVRERGISPPRPERRPPSPAADAKRLLRSFERAYETRGLGIADHFLGDRTGERFAEVFRDVYGDDALDWAQAMRGWLDAAAAALEREFGEVDE